MHKFLHIWSRRREVTAKRQSVVEKRSKRKKENNIIFLLARTHGNPWVRLNVAEKTTPDTIGIRGGLVEATGFSPLADAPRQTIINRLFCPTRLHFFESARQNARPHSQLPPSNPVPFHLYQQKRDRQLAYLFFVVEATGFEPTTSATRTNTPSFFDYFC